MVRLSTSVDVPSLHRLVNSAYRGASSRKGWTTEADFLGGQRIDEARLSEMLADKNQKILCLVDVNGLIIGCVNLQKFEDAKGVGCYLGMLSIDPEAQASGLGKQLMTEAQKFARAWGAKRITLTVIQVRTELMAWYERRGFVKTGEREDFPYGDIRYGEPTRDDLYFVKFEKTL